ncbi:O-antigen ligase family protein, partial [Proteus mirabilis]
LLFIIYWIISSSIRFFISGDNLRDALETFRFIPIFLFFLYKKCFIIKKQSLYNIFIVYIVLNSFLCFLQYYYKSDSTIVNFIAYFYNSDIHFNESLLLNSRALGFSMGPNSNAVIILLCLFFIFFKYKPTSKLQSFLKYITITLGIISLILSQSQTGIIALIAISIYLIVMYFIKKPQIITVCTLFITFFAVIIIANTSLLDKLSDKNGGLYYLSTLFKQGTERSSYQIRIEKRNAMIDTAISKPFYSFIGWGKDYFGDESSATDNEHLYIALIYGPIIWILILSVAFYYGSIYTIKYLYSKNFELLLVPTTMLCWVIVAIPAAFITYPEALILSALLLNNSKRYEY